MASQEEKRRRERDAQDLRAVMSTLEGRRLLWTIIDDWGGAFSGSFTGDALTGAYSEGRRSLAIDLMRQLQAAAPADYMRALQEAVGERQEEAREKERAAQRARRDDGLDDE
jgi:hypothetical protein